MFGIPTSKSSFQAFTKTTLPELTLENLNNAMLAEQIALVSPESNYGNPQSFLNRVNSVSDKLSQLSKEELAEIEKLSLPSQSLLETYLSNSEDLQYLNLENKVQPEGLPQISAIC